MLRSLAYDRAIDRLQAAGYTTELHAPELHGAGWLLLRWLRGGTCWHVARRGADQQELLDGLGRAALRWLQADAGEAGRHAAREPGRHRR